MPGDGMMDRRRDGQTDRVNPVYPRPLNLVAGGIMTSEVHPHPHHATPLRQNHGKVFQYISPDLYFLCPTYIRFSPNGFNMRC